MSRNAFSYTAEHSNYSKGPKSSPRALVSLGQVLRNFPIYPNVKHIKKKNNCHLDGVNICREDINFPVRGSLSARLHPLWLFLPSLTSVHRRVPRGLRCWPTHRPRGSLLNSLRVVYSVIRTSCSHTDPRPAGFPGPWLALMSFFPLSLL